MKKKKLVGNQSIMLDWRYEKKEKGESATAQTSPPSPAKSGASAGTSKQQTEVSGSKTAISGKVIVHHSRSFEVMVQTELSGSKTEISGNTPIGQ